MCAWGGEVGLGREGGVKKLPWGVRTRTYWETTHTAKHFTEGKQDTGTLNEETRLRRGEVNSDFFFFLRSWLCRQAQPQRGCTTTAKFPTGCAFLVLPPPSHSSLRKNGMGSIFSQNGSLHPPLSKLLIQPSLHLNLQPWLACAFP